MNTVIKYLLVVLTFLELAKTAVRNLDANKTGADDAFADFAQKIIDEINGFIATHPPVESTVARGYTATLAFCNNILQQLDLLIESALPKAEKVALATALVADLTDDSKVYPAKKGNDARVLEDTKVKAGLKLETIKNQ